MQHSRVRHFGYQNNGDKNHFLPVMFYRGGGWGTARAVLWMVYDESHQHLGVAASLSPLKTTSWGRIPPGVENLQRKMLSSFHQMITGIVDMQYASCSRGSRKSPSRIRLDGPSMTPTWGNVVTGHLAEPGVLRCVPLAWHGLHLAFEKQNKKPTTQVASFQIPVRMSFLSFPDA